MFIYNGKISDTSPEAKNTKKFKVTLEDVLLTYVGYDIKGGRVLVTYSISYFNVPQNVKEYEIERNIDFDSLKKVVNETIPEMGKFLSVEGLSSKQVKIVFDVDKFLRHASYPAKVINQKSMAQVKLKLNQNLPEVIRQIDDGSISALISNVMTSIIRKDRKYRHIFSHMNSWAYSKSTVVTAIYILDENAFFVEIKDPFKMIYYFATK